MVVGKILLSDKTLMYGLHIPTCAAASQPIVLSSLRVFELLKPYLVLELWSVELHLAQATAGYKK